MSKLALLTALAATVLAAGANLAAADTCRNVDIRVNNSFHHGTSALQIKVIDFDYWDDTEGKWREEAFVGNQIINPGFSAWIATGRNLSFVGGEHDVQIRVQFRYLTATNGWSDVLEAYSEPFFCLDRTIASLPITVDAK